MMTAGVTLTVCGGVLAVLSLASLGRLDDEGRWLVEGAIPPGGTTAGDEGGDARR